MKTITYKKIQVSYLKKGKGEAVVLLHGFLEDHSIWEYFINRLSEHFTVIVPDLLGHGKTPVISDSHTMEMQADMVLEILKHENISNAAIVGHSMGGYIALAFADLFPDATRGVCLFHSTAFADSDQKKQDRLRSIDIVKNDSRHYVNDLVPKLFAPSNLERLSEDVEKIKEIGRRTPVEGITAALKGMSERKDRTLVLSTINDPVQFILGKQDSVIDLNKNIELLSLPRKSYAAILENVGHMGYLEDPMTSYINLEEFALTCFL